MAPEQHYATDLMRISKPEKVAEVMNQRWADGWRFVFMYHHDAGVLLTFERRD